MGMDQELYRFRAIIEQLCPLLASDPDWKASKYNVLVEWETEEISLNPFPSLLLMTESPVQHMPKGMIYLL